MSSKFRKNAWDTTSRQNQNPQQRCKWYFIIWNSCLAVSDTYFFFTDFSWITLCWCGIFFHAFPGDHSSHAIYLAPGNLEKYHRHISLQGLYSCLAANWFSKEADRYCHYYVIFKILWRSAFFIVQLSHPYMTTGKTIALTRQSYVSKVMSLLFNRLL